MKKEKMFVKKVKKVKLKSLYLRFEKAVKCP